jgi:hypothetical protein
MKTGLLIKVNYLINVKNKGIKIMIIYYIDGEKFTTDDYDTIPRSEISSLDENTPAIECVESGQKLWCEKGRIYHRLIGPSKIWRDGREEFSLNGTDYENVHDWLKDHPNPNLYFYNIGVLTETDKVLWYLKN